jgi:hypothetical protein
MEFLKKIVKSDISFNSPNYILTKLKIDLVIKRQKTFLENSKNHLYAKYNLQTNDRILRDLCNKLIIDYF